MFSKKLMKQIYSEVGPHPNFRELFDPKEYSTEHKDSTGLDARVFREVFYDEAFGNGKRTVDFVLFYGFLDDTKHHTGLYGDRYTIGSAQFRDGQWFAEMGWSPVGAYDTLDEAQRCIEVAYYG